MGAVVRRTSCTPGRARASRLTLEDTAASSTRAPPPHPARRAAPRRRGASPPLARRHDHLRPRPPCPGRRGGAPHPAGGVGRGCCPTPFGARARSTGRRPICTLDRQPAARGLRRELLAPPPRRRGAP